MLIPTIIKKILDCKEHIIKNDDIQKLKYMFIEINKYINQHNILQKRKKFFSYNFILFILFEKLQQNELKIFILYPQISKNIYYQGLMPEFDNFFM